MHNELPNLQWEAMDRMKILRGWPANLPWQEKLGGWRNGWLEVGYDRIAGKGARNARRR